MKKVLYILGGLVLVIIIVAAISGEPEEEPVNGEPTETEAEEVLEDEEFTIGDSIDHENRVLTVDSVERDWVSPSDFETPSEGNAYVLVELTLENESEEEVSFNPFHFEIQDGGGVIQGQALITGINTLSSGNLAPGGEISGNLVFEVNEENIEELTLFYEPAFWGDDRVEVEL